MSRFALPRHVMTAILVLAALLAGCSAPPSGDTGGAPRTLRLCAYNIRHGEGMDGRIDLERIAAVIARTNPDLVALQEVDNRCQRSGNRDLAAELGRRLGMDHRFGMFMEYQGGEYGMAVLSRLPITATVRHPLPEGAEPRCALEIRVAHTDWPGLISFVGIHNDWTDAGIRLEQVRALLAALKGCDHAVILAGDFNGNRDDPSMRLLADAGWAIPGKPGRRTYPSPEPVKEIDFFAIRGMPGIEVEEEVVDERVASDHRPIVALITLPPVPDRR